MIQKILNYLQIFLGFVILSRLCYMRLFRMGSTREIIENLYANENYLRLMIYFWLFCIFFTGFWVSLQVIRNRPSKYNFKFFEKFVDWYKNTINSVFIFFGGGLPEGFLTPFLISFGCYLHKKLLTSDFVRYGVVFSLHFLPRLLFLIAFIYDIYVEKFFMIYYCGPLLLIPFIIKRVFNLFKYFFYKNLLDLNEIMESVNMKTQETYTMSACFLRHLQDHNAKYETNHGFQLCDQYIQDVLQECRETNTFFDYEKTLKQFIAQFGQILLPIGTTMLIYEFELNRMAKYFNLGYYLSFTIIWAYLLYNCF